MGRGPADEAVVLVKPDADDAAVTSLRGKHQASDKDAGGEGRNTLRGVTGGRRARPKASVVRQERSPIIPPRGAKNATRRGCFFACARQFVWR